MWPEGSGSAEPQPIGIADAGKEILGCSLVRCYTNGRGGVSGMGSPWERGRAEYIPVGAVV